MSIVILSLIVSLLRIVEQYKAKKVEIRVALLHVPRFPTDYVISLARSFSVTLLAYRPLSPDFLFMQSQPPPALRIPRVSLGPRSMEDRTTLAF